MTAKATWGLRRGELAAPGTRVLGALGGGRRTEVYRCSSELVGRTVAVKLLRPDRLGLQDRERLAREAEVLGHLAHEGFPALHGHDSDGDRPYLVMDHVDGPHLSTLRREFGPLEPEQLASVARDVAGALAHLHAMGFVHLDVKPGNVVVAARPVLLDLGAARTVAACRDLPPGYGTFSTMAPEQVEPAGRGPVGPAADVFGLGVTLAVAAGAENPLRRRRDEDPTDEAVLLDALRSACRPIERPLRDLVLACLEPRPDERPTAAEVARHGAVHAAPAGGVVSRLAAAMRGLSAPSQGGLTDRP